MIANDIVGVVVREVMEMEMGSGAILHPCHTNDFLLPEIRRQWISRPAAVKQIVVQHKLASDPDERRPG